tara:strand:- start:219 stop:356 length:138 start_codon:yes stop_codon:yes gene_type:complete
MEIIGKMLGFLAAYFTMAILGLLSIFSPSLSDELLEAVIRWSETE